MSIREVPMYQVVCDRCGREAHKDSEYWAWAEPTAAELEAEDSLDWLVQDGHWCPDCWVFNDDGERVAPSKSAAKADAEADDAP